MEKKSQTLYLECGSGISGDMTVAALLELGADRQVLDRALNSLPVNGFQTAVTRVKKSGLDMCDFRVILDAEHENHDYDMEYLHGHGTHPCGKTHGEGRAESGTHGHIHEHRSLPDILHIISHADMTERAKKMAARVFSILAEAEAKAHGVSAEQVHFHEVGAVDSIVDIVAVSVCLDDLNITEVIIPRLNEGCGTVRCQHGILPVPVPAVMNIAEAYQLPLHITETEGELVTPTGAAVAAAVRTSGRLPDTFTIEKIGMGAGKRSYDRPSILRAMLIHPEEEKKERIYKLETNIDDSSGENLGYAMERLLEAGAKDVYYTPIYMKKNRPACQLNILCAEEDVKRMEQIVFEETTTIGIRKAVMERTVLPREIRIVQTPLGEAKVKVCSLNGREQYFPEYESITALCRKYHRNYREVYQMIQRACEVSEEA